MSKIPRDLNATELIHILSKKFGYIVKHQKGSHIRMVNQNNNEKKLTIPNHNPIKIGTLSSILNEVADQNILTKSEVIKLCFEG